MMQASTLTLDMRVRDMSNQTSRAILLPANSPLPSPAQDPSDNRRAQTQLDVESISSNRLIDTKIAPLEPYVISVKGYVAPQVGPLATVLQIWEGVILELNSEGNSMLVKLVDRQGLVSAHTAELGLDWVVPQDLDLVRPGAVFYWTIYRETKRSTIRHSQEIRFRRLPNWTKKQVAGIGAKAAALLGKFSVAPQAS